MGVQEIIRDHFLAARDYERGVEALGEGQDGHPAAQGPAHGGAARHPATRSCSISSHGYRADEFLALVRLAEEFGFRMQTLQHGVEAYKIATELKASGVAAVVWSDWGAFKLEAYDATTYNARILMEAGVVTSLHSDDAEISTRMNWEAGKLLRTGVDEIAGALHRHQPVGEGDRDRRPGRLARGRQGRRLRDLERQPALAVHQGRADVGGRPSLLLARGGRGAARGDRAAARAAHPGGARRRRDGDTDHQRVRRVRRGQGSN